MSGHSMRGHSMSGHSMGGRSMSGYSNQLKSSNLSNRYVKNGKEKEKEKERKKEKEKEKPKLNSLKYSFIMFEISVENMFETNENYRKYSPKSDQNRGLGRVRNRMGTRIVPEHQSVKSVTSFWRSFWSQFDL